MNRKEFHCRYVKAGRVRAVGNMTADIEILPGALAHAWADGLFESRAVFVDHAAAFEYPSLRNLVGVTLEAQYHELDGAVDGIVRLYDTPEALAFGELVEQWLADRQIGEATPDIGLSLVFYPVWEAMQTPGNGLRRINGIRHIESVDFVFEPATEARVMQALSGYTQTGCPGAGDRLSIYTNARLNAGVGHIADQIDHRNIAQMRKENNRMNDSLLNQEAPA